MRKLALLSIILLAMLAAGVYTVYRAGSAPAIETPKQVEANTPIEGPVLLQPVLATWIMGDQPVVSKGDSTFAVHIVLLTDQQTTIIYSLSGPNANIPLAGSSMQMGDDTAQVYKSTQVTSLAQLDRLQLGALTFQPRKVGARQLHVLFHFPNDTNLSDAVPAKLTGTSESPSSPGILGAPFREGYLDQASYRISFNGWGFEKGDAIAQAQANSKGMTLEEIMRQAATKAAQPQHPGPTPTPVPADQAVLQLSGGKPVYLAATLRIEDTLTKQVRYMYIVFLASGEVKATLLNLLFQPFPIHQIGAAINDRAN